MDSGLGNYCYKQEVRSSNVLEVTGTCDFNKFQIQLHPCKSVTEIISPSLQKRI